MKRRLLDTATVLLDKFVNRYHDYEDFWAIGVLYSYCQSLDQSSLTFNLIDRDCFGRDEFLKQVNIKFSDDLDKYLAIHKKRREDLADATITIAFDKDHKISSETLFGDYFQVRVILIDSYGRRFMRYSDGYCVSHTLWLEQRNYIDSLSIETHHIVGSIHFPLTRPIKSLPDTDILFNDIKAV
ncbi:hypothetical protein [Acinetobacter colistiniresistens]|uniref:Uncharacterized protein n=1 Tax=Acinetobacter colistiniresistens TaxID=280145 RepID=S3UCU7_9GAMM|nr:hypothetical protein [Acinetobacter colistiniresistens]EPG37277.1 hypothetical protein F907_01244 [Acinetobacter colistiniresistens]TVT83869.1 hypothetical protein FPV60_06675 [Acinetobacter colistiniresistens]